MSFIQSQYWFLILFAIIPILLHLFKKRNTKKVSISSLYLLNRKSKTLNRRLRIHQLLLLICRCSLVCTVGIYFLIPIMHEAPEALTRWIPFKEPALVLLDTRWDSASSLREEVLRRFPLASADNFQFLELEFGNFKPLDEIAIEASSGAQTKVILCSRFYGVSRDEINNIKVLNVDIMVVGPPQITNTALTEIQFTPARPLLGESVEIKGIVQTIDHNLKNIRLSVRSPAKLEQKLSLPITQERAEFNSSIKAEKSPLQEVEVRHEHPDSIPGDDLASFEIPVKSSLRVAMVDDQNSPDSKRSRLYYINKFFQGLSASYPEITLKIESFSSANFSKNSTKAYDWIIIGDMESEWLPESKDKTFLFWQKNQKIQRSIDEKFGFKSFALESIQKDISIPNIPTQDRYLLSKPWKTMRYLQTKMNGGTIYLRADQEPLIFRKDHLFFCAMDFSEYDFTGTFEPYFPIFLFRFFLERWDSNEETLKVKIPITRREVDFEKMDLSGKVGEKLADFSLPLLILALALALMELLLIRRLESAVLT